MAGGEGLEPPTFWFEARHSNPAELTAVDQKSKMIVSDLTGKCQDQNLRIAAPLIALVLCKIKLFTRNEKEAV